MKKEQIFAKNQVPKLLEQGWEVIKEVNDKAVLMSREYPVNFQIKQLKQFLLDTDYKAIKYAEGELTDLEYDEMKKARKRAREEIRILEEKL